MSRSPTTDSLHECVPAAPGRGGAGGVSAPHRPCLEHGRAPVDEAEHHNNTPRWNRAPVDLDQLLTLHGFIGPWPDNLIVDDLTWPQVMASIMNHPAMREIEKLYRLPLGQQLPRLRLFRIRPAELNSVVDDYLSS